MCSELECGICYWSYNAGRRCPRELHCKHSFCESCLLALLRPRLRPEDGEACPGDERVIDCPLCRQTTSITGEGNMRAELRVDEFVLERLITVGVFDREEEEEESYVQGETEEATLPGTPAEERHSSAGSRGGKWSKLWRMINGKSSRQRRRENCMTNDDLRDFALMSCYMF